MMERTIVRAAFALGCFAGVAPVLAETPFSFDAAYGRLPKNVVPLAYTLEITPDLKALSTAGQESVLLRVRKVTDTIQFNSLNEKLSDVMLDGKPVKQVTTEDDKQLTTITLAAPTTVGEHTLSFNYSGKIESQSRGLFAQKYSQPRDGIMLTTQFESTDARRMFPCWDEPAFRSTFQLTVKVPASWATVGNMPIATRKLSGDVATVTFKRTPKMPTYLMEFTGGDIASLSAKADGYDFGVWAVRGREQDGQTALADAQTILADYNDYFGYRFPLPKLDSIAIPGGFSGAMENWGAITYTDAALLVNASSAVGDKQQVFAVQAHEMAHQWNGDLVTMGWWDDIWLNESFASWMAAKETAQRHPEWKWWENQDGDKEGAMSADARATAHAIQVHVTDELQADNAFDPQITYSKGQAILRMFEAYLGPDVFRDGIRGYMKARAFSNATSADLWNALSAASGKNVGEIASSWTEQPGFPLVSVKSQCDAGGARTITLSQKRFILGGGTDAKGSATKDQRWSVPLQVRIGEDEMTQSVLLTQDKQSVSAGRCDQALSVNANAIGYFRAKYDASALAANTRDFGRMRDADRIVLLDDQWALAGSGLSPLSNYLALAASMGSDMDPRAWVQISGALQAIEFAERQTPGHDAFVKYARSILKPAFDVVGWDAKPGESPSIQELRQSLIADLGQWGDPSVIAEAHKRFQAFVKDRKAIAPDNQGSILNVVAHDADETTFNQLYAIAKSGKDQIELQRYFLALANVSDPKLAERVVKIALSADIPPESDSLRLNLVASLSNEHQHLSWQTLTTNLEVLTKAQTTFAPLVIAQYMPQVYWSGIPLQEIDAFARAHVPKEMSDVVDRGMESARYQLTRKTLLVHEADGFLQQRGG
jgi:aminopeptidase N